MPIVCDRGQWILEQWTNSGRVLMAFVIVVIAVLFETFDVHGAEIHDAIRREDLETVRELVSDNEFAALILLKAGADVIAPNGKPFTEESIGMTLAVRNLMTDLRSAGEVTGGFEHAFRRRIDKASRFQSG